MLHCGDLLNFIQNQSHGVALREYGTLKKIVLVSYTEDQRNENKRLAPSRHVCCHLSKAT